MAKSEFLMLAHKYDPDKHVIAGAYISEKLDGVRAFWDGGISCGLRADEIPWANVEKDRKTTICTGLWTRYGKIIYAPAWWLESLPKSVCFDGELYCGMGDFQRLISTVKQHVPDSRWQSVTYRVFDSPHYPVVMGDRIINNTQFRKSINGAYVWAQGKVEGFHDRLFLSFEPTYHWLTRLFAVTPMPHCILHSQVQLPFHTAQAQKYVDEFCNQIVEAGGEGAIIRRAMSTWVPERSHDLLKVKPWKDSEGIVVGYKWGELTDKGSKLLGMMGSLRVSWKGVEFDLSGFTDSERQMIGSGEPGSIANSDSYNPMFRCGTKVTFKYRDLTDSGTPKEARYFRKYNYWF